MSPATITLAIISYIALLFWLARRGDRVRFVADSWVRHPLVYALALGVYCTSWTFYGLVGTASVSTWQFIPILLGPILLFTIGFPVIVKIYQICKQEHIHNIADFIASRYGRRQGIAAFVTLVVLLATVPYIALQLKAVSDTLGLVIGTNALGNQDLTFFIAAAMILFALLFGTSQLDISGYHGGLMNAIAFESIVKLLALALVAAFAFYFLSSDQSFSSVLPSPDENPPPARLGLRFFVETGLAACAIFCLPRMFQITFVECLSKAHLSTARFTFPLYLVAIGFCIYLIAQAGNQIFAGTDVSSDTYVIAIPIHLESDILTLVAFLGGFSAATAMIIVATITLSQMLSNDVILPLIMRRQSGQQRFRDYTRLLILARRGMVIFVVFAAYLYQLLLASNAALTSIGLIAFALSVHLAPAILMGLYWKRCNAIGVYAGLGSGVLVWAYMLITPIMSDIGLVAQSYISQGPYGFEWLSPEFFLGFEFSDAFTRSVLVSLGINIAVTWLVSRVDRTTLADRIQASTFTQIELQKPVGENDSAIKIGDLKELANQFAGARIADRIFEPESINPEETSPEELIETVRRALSGIAGVASANAMIDGLRSGNKIAVEDVVSMFGETTKALRFNQEILFSSFENISSGISVVNDDLNIVAWNRRYEEMFNYPKNMLKIGTPVSELVQFNAHRGLLGAGDIELLVHKRLEHLKNGKPYRVVREHHDGQVIEIKGTPLPDGGYVTTYDDISDFIRIQNELELSNQNLEKRVESRTEEINRINQDLVHEIELRKGMETALLEAKSQAETANATKSRFLALASHDILQPLNAAQLYVTSLLEAQNERRDTRIVRQISNSIASAESIISSLLDIARIDTDSIEPKLSSVPLDQILKSLIDEAQVQLPEEVALHYIPSSVHVLSDQKMLSRIVQNFISNAVKYTAEGRIIVGCRRHDAHVELFVIDSGPGIPKDDLEKVFNDFFRSQAQIEQAGLGLGLAVAKRLADLLDHKIRVQSVTKKGSSFSITLPIASPQTQNDESNAIAPTHELAGMSIVYVDDGAENISATEALLHRWQCKMTGIQIANEAIEYSEQHSAPDALLMDFQLNDEHFNGLTLAETLRDIWGEDLPVCIISAAPDPDLPINARQRGFDFLSKPVKPAKLRAWLTHIHEH
ncbi:MULTISPECIES: PAS domain-containing hybrid sensor histidine kinase/response regulator [unclassified Oleiphilus]|jgi:Na+/proline symporter/signal transduction histidine kinase|nr:MULTISPECIES: PAS domain-containing hybrid sensor histidine kinase/response regulator [unclassified Oleiphilus]